MIIQVKCLPWNGSRTITLWAAVTTGAISWVWRCGAAVKWRYFTNCIAVIVLFHRGHFDLLLERNEKKKTFSKVTILVGIVTKFKWTTLHWFYDVVTNPSSTDMLNIYKRIFLNFSVYSDSSWSYSACKWGSGGNKLMQTTLISFQEITQQFSGFRQGMSYTNNADFDFTWTTWTVVTDASAEIICASPHPNRQAGNFRPWENKLACFTHSSQSREWGGRGNETDRRREGKKLNKTKGTG